MPRDEVDLLRSVLARTYEKSSPFPLRLVEAVQDYIGTRTPRNPIIESLNISERKMRPKYCSVLKQNEFDVKACCAL